jgi:hypothetical protein
MGIVCVKIAIEMFLGPITAKVIIGFYMFLLKASAFDLRLLRFQSNMK